MAKQVNKTEVSSLSEEEREKKKLSHRYFYLKEMINFKNEYSIENIDAVYLFRFLCLLDNFCSYKNISIEKYINMSMNESFYLSIKEKLSNEAEFRKSTIKAIELCIEVCQKQYDNKKLERLYYIDDFISDLSVFAGERYTYIGHSYNFYSPSIFLEEDPLYDNEIKPDIEKIKSNDALSDAQKIIEIQKITSDYISNSTEKIADLKKLTLERKADEKLRGYCLAKQLIEESQRGAL